MHKAYDMLSAVANDASSTFINDALSSILFKKNGAHNSYAPLKN